MTWVPMQKAVPVQNERTRAYMAANPTAAEHAQLIEEMWQNDRYVVIVYRRKDTGTVECLSIRRQDRGAIRDWRHMQKIKTELAGADVEAFQVFPAEDRLVDTANQTWLWCLPPGVRLPVGFTERSIGGPEEAEAVGSRQRAFEEGILEEEDAA